MTKGVSIGKDVALCGAWSDAAPGVGLAGFGPKQTKRSWRRRVFVAGWRVGVCWGVWGGCGSFSGGGGVMPVCLCVTETPD